MENVVWDVVPTQRTRKVEKYSTPVLTMIALKEEGQGRKFIFNKAAQTHLGIEGEDKISLGFVQDSTDILITKSNSDSGYKLTKTCTFSDKKVFDFISKRLLLDNSVENEFNIVTVEGKNYSKLELRTSTNSTTEEVIFESADLGTIEESSNDEADLSAIPTPEAVVEDTDGSVFESEVNEEEDFEEEDLQPKGAVYSASGTDLDEEEEELWD